MGHAIERCSGPSLNMAMQLSGFYIFTRTIIEYCGFHALYNSGEFRLESVMNTYNNF